MDKKKTNKIVDLLKRHVVQNYKEYLVIMVFFIVGLFFGVFFINQMEEEQISQVHDYLNGFVQNLKNTSDINEQKEIISGYSLYLLDFKKKLSEVADLLSINPNEYSDFYHTVVADPTIFVPVNRLSQAQINKVNNMMETTNVVTSTDVLKQLKLNPKMLNYPVTTELKFPIDD